MRLMKVLGWVAYGTLFLLMGLRPGSPAWSMFFGALALYGVAMAGVTIERGDK